MSTNSPEYQRVSYIKIYKPKEEQDLRLRLFKLIPLDKLPAEWKKADAELLSLLVTLHEELCPECPWDGKTIFTEVK